MHRSKSQIIGVVEFVSPMRSVSAAPRFGVVTWNLVTATVRWQNGNLTRVQAMGRFASMKAGVPVELIDEIELRINVRKRNAVASLEKQE